MEEHDYLQCLYNSTTEKKYRKSKTMGGDGFFFLCPFTLHHKFYLLTFINPQPTKKLTTTDKFHIAN